MKGVLYYDSKYGSTRKVSEWIISEIKCADVNINKITNCENIEYDCEFYIIGTPIFVGKPMESIIDFIYLYKEYLSKKDVFIFITSWAQSTIYNLECKKFIELMKFYLSPCSPILEYSLPGQLYMDKITLQDRNVMNRLLRRIDIMSDEFKSENIIFNDQTSKKQSEKFGCDINEWIKCKYNMF